jgi:hypothetical protein
MKKNNVFKRLVIFAVVIGLCMTALQISALSTIISSSEHRISKIDSAHFIRGKHSLSRTLTKEKIVPLEFNHATFNGDIPIIMTENNCQNPAIANDGSNILVMAEESQGVFESDLLIVYSSDSGDTWSDIYTFFTEDVIETKPVVDYCENNEFQAYGTCLPDLDGALYFIHFPSMIDPYAVWGESDGWTIWQTTLDFNDYYAIDISGYPPGENAPTPEFHGILGLIGNDPNYGEILEEFYEIEGGEIGACYLAFEGELGDTITNDIDLSTATYFEAKELKNEPDLIEDGVFLEHCWVEPGNENWWENPWPGFVFEGAHNPDLAADSGNCYCICEFDGDIVCYYSNDNGENFQASNVATNGQFPSVSAFGEKAICTFIRNNDLYVATSVDGGETWEESSSPINDESGSAVEQDHGADIAGSFVTWTDDRNAPPTEIYFDVSKVGSPPGAPDIDGKTSGKTGTSYPYTFTSTDPDGDQVSYYIEWGDGDITDWTALQASGPPGYSESHTWAAEGTYTIKAKAKDEFGLVGSEATLTVTMPRNRAVNTPFQWFLQQHPNLFPILKILLLQR